MPQGPRSHPPCGRGVPLPPRAAGPGGRSGVGRPPVAPGGAPAAKASPVGPVAAPAQGPGPGPSATARPTAPHMPSGTLPSGAKPIPRDWGR